MLDRKKAMLLLTRRARQDEEDPWGFLRLFTYIPRRLVGVVVGGILMHNNIINPIN